MNYGNLTVYVGPMFAGKTNELVREILFRTYFGGPARASIYKISFDDRCKDECLMSHDGLRAEAKTITASSEIITDAAGWAFFDEVQFFTEPNFSGEFIQSIRTLRENGVDVFCAGLDMDYLGRAFEVTSLLMAEASSIIRLTADCEHCAAPATHTARCDPDPDRFVLGASETYSPMCAEHWFTDLKSKRGRTHN